MFLPADHTFVVCAYGESQYLQACVESLLGQTVASRVVISTSTPNGFIKEISEKYSIPLFMNPERKGIASDWNFALKCADTPLITLAHQDDLYEPDYTSTMLSVMNRVKSPVIFSSNYSELRNGKKVYSNKLLNIKKILRLPMRLFPGSVTARRLSLAFGDPICCPSVTYVRKIILEYPFSSGLYASLDWQQWEVLSNLKGSFAYSNKFLLSHRIHAESETSRIINDTSRTMEDLEMFRKFWPERIARLLSHAYANGEKSNNI